MKFIQYVGVVMLLMITCQEVNAQSERYLQENVAFTDLEAVKTQGGMFYYQLKLRDFGNSLKAPDGFGLNGYTFMDNGEGNDKVKGDGIYAANETKSTKLLLRKPIRKRAFVDSKFKHMNSLTAVVGDSSNIGISCTIVPCGCPCPPVSCAACTMFGWSCWTVTSCEIDIGIA